MKRLLTLLLTITLSALGIWADSQIDLNRYLKSYNSQMKAGQYLPAARSVAAAAKVCADARNYDGAFKLLSNADKTLAAHDITPDSMPSVYYITEKARFNIYRSIDNKASAAKVLSRMGTHAKKSGNKNIVGDMLFNEAQYYYAIGQNAKGDLCIARLIKQFDNSTDYKTADTAYRKLISKAVSANDAALVGHTYESYMQWSDSIEAITSNTKLGKVRKKFAASQETIAEKDHAIKARTGWVVTFITLFVITLAALGVGALFYWRVIAKNRRMKKSVQAANAQSAAKSAILHNMSAQMKPALDKLDQENPSVKNLRGYIERVGELSDVENSEPRDIESLENINLEEFCREIADNVRPKLKPRVVMNLDGTRGYARIDSLEVSKILTHLLDNAARFTPEGGKITLAYRKRGAKSHQFIVTDSGPGIPEEERENLFTAFSKTCDLEDGDRLGLSICALRAEKINGTLTIDPAITNGASFVLTIHS